MAAVLGAALMLCRAHPAEAATPFALVGKITNGTAGGSVPGNLAVIASQLDENNNEVDRKQANAGADGSFRIEGYDLDKGTRFIMGTDYLGVTYTRILEDPQPPESQVDLAIFETTEDDSGIKVLTDVLTVVPGTDDTFEMIQLQRISNGADRTYVGRETEEGRSVLRLPVPGGSFDFAPVEGILVQGLTTARGGVITGSPVIPGESSLSWVYKVRSPRAWDLRRQVFYPTDRADLLAEETLTLTSERFEFEERVTLGETAYRQFRAADLGPSDVIEANIARAGSAPGRGLLWGGVGALALVAIGGLVTVTARRRKRSRAAATPPDSAPAQAASDRESLVQQIAELDEEFEAGRLSDDEYATMREELKERLRTLQLRPTHERFD